MCCGGRIPSPPLLRRQVAAYPTATRNARKASFVDRRDRFTNVADCRGGWLRPPVTTLGFRAGLGAAEDGSRLRNVVAVRRGSPPLAVGEAEFRHRGEFGLPRSLRTLARDLPGSRGRSPSSASVLYTGSLPATASTAGSASAVRWPWRNCQRASDMPKPGYAHGSAVLLHEHPDVGCALAHRQRERRKPPPNHGLPHQHRQAPGTLARAHRHDSRLAERVTSPDLAGVNQRESHLRIE